jgi:hypothetical protein
VTVCFDYAAAIMVSMQAATHRVHSSHRPGQNGCTGM